MHLRTGGTYLLVPHASQPSNDYTDHDLFPSLYPTLFPYGNGGFDCTDRRVPLSMKDQVLHYLSLPDRRFQEHHSFAFIAFNILQRRLISLNVRLRLQRQSFSAFAQQLSAITPAVVEEVVRKTAQSDYSASTAEERNLYKLMSQVNIVSGNVPGTASSKLYMRNELRGLMMHTGLPTFFITLNFADKFNPLVRVLSGRDDYIFDYLTSENIDLNEQRHIIAKCQDALR